MLIATVFAFARGNTEFVFYIVAMVVMIALVAFVHARVQLSQGVLWGLSLWGALHMAGGLVHIPADWPRGAEAPVLYNLWLLPEVVKYDQLIHAFGFGVSTWVCWEGLAAVSGERRKTLGALSLAGLAALGLGAMNEVLEFIATLSIPETNVGGYLNTGWDLVANLVGVVIACISIRLWAKEERSA